MRALVSAPKDLKCRKRFKSLFQDFNVVSICKKISFFQWNHLTHICDELRESGNGLIPGISREIIPIYGIHRESHRIVDRIESLFAKLDQPKELVQDGLDSFETRKAAILHKAFTGELTAKWREEHGLGIDSWRENKLGQLLRPMITCKPDKSYEYFYYIDIDTLDNKTQTVKEAKKIPVSNAPSRASRGLESGNV